MIDIYKTNTKTGELEKQLSVTKGCWVNISSPTEEEIKEVVEMTLVSEQLLRYPLDIAEKAHIDNDEEELLVAIDVASTEIKDEKRIYTTIPLGMIIVRDDIFITISQRRVDVIENILNSVVLSKSKKSEIATEKKSRFIIQILYKVSQEYIKYMSYISKDIEAFEDKMDKATKNEELVRLFEFEKSMIYFNSSIKANQTVLQKISRGKVIKLYEEDEDILEDTIIENVQAIEMIETYSDILNGIIDILGTMVSNNLNNVMKFLTSITLIISIPTLITSFMGMNVQFPFDTNIFGFFGITAIAICITIGITYYLKKKDLF